MKRIITCCVITAVIAALGIFSLAYTDNITKKISEELQQVKSELSGGDFEAALSEAREMSSAWESFRKMHFLTVDNDHSLEITMTAQRICSLLEREDEEAITECDVMIRLVEVYGREQVPNIMNIL